MIQQTEPATSNRRLQVDETMKPRPPNVFHLFQSCGQQTTEGAS